MHVPPPTTHPPHPLPAHSTPPLSLLIYFCVWVCDVCETLELLARSWMWLSMGWVGVCVTLSSYPGLPQLGRAAAAISSCCGGLVHCRRPAYLIDCRAPCLGGLLGVRYTSRAHAHARKGTGTNCTQLQTRTGTTICLLLQSLNYALEYTATHRYTLQHTATHCNTLHYTAPYCTTLHHAAQHCTKR